MIANIQSALPQLSEQNYHDLLPAFELVRLGPFMAMQSEMVYRAVLTARRRCDGQYFYQSLRVACSTIETSTPEFVRKHIDDLLWHAILSMSDFSDPVRYPRLTGQTDQPPADQTDPNLA